MKIKDVCRQTGLTDRAIRYYIEEKLIAPDFAENYLGRRHFVRKLPPSLCELSKVFGIAYLRQLTTHASNDIFFSYVS